MQNRLERVAAKQQINSMLQDLDDDISEYNDYLMGGGDFWDSCDCGTCPDSNPRRAPHKPC